MRHGKVSEKKDTSEKLNILSDCPINNEVITQQNYLQYINSLRQKFKKQVPEIPYLDIYEDLICLDKVFIVIFLYIYIIKNLNSITSINQNDFKYYCIQDYTGILPEDKVFSILAKYKIYINKTFLIPLLDLLQIYKEKNIKYEDLLNLLNWKYDFPTLPKIESKFLCFNFII